MRDSFSACGVVQNDVGTGCTLNSERGCVSGPAIVVHFLLSYSLNVIREGDLDSVPAENRKLDLVSMRSQCHRP